MKKLLTLILVTLLAGCGSVQLDDVNYADLALSVQCINRGIDCGILAEDMFASTEDNFIENWTRFNECLYSLTDMGCLQQAAKFQEILNNAMEQHNGHDN